jgi:isopentenyl phosphate kinase
MMEIRKLEMMISVLKFQNEALKKSMSLSIDSYYEDVINGMQNKIEELMEIREREQVS